MDAIQIVVIGIVQGLDLCQSKVIGQRRMSRGSEIQPSRVSTCVWLRSDHMTGNITN